MALDPVNPKLKAAMEEIKAILKREDIAATIVLCSGQQAEYLNYIAAPDGPTWSALRWVGGGIRFTAKPSSGHVERWRFVSSLKAINTMRDLMAHQFSFYDAACQATQHLVDPVAERVHKPHEEKKP